MCKVKYSTSNILQVYVVLQLNTTTTNSKLRLNDERIIIVSIYTTDKIINMQISKQVIDQYDNHYNKEQ